MEKVTKTMLAGIAASRMREEPGCRTVSSVQIVVTPTEWQLGMVTYADANHSDITRARIAVQRAMKEQYELVQDS